MRLDNKCHCNPKDNFDWKGYSCELIHPLILCWAAREVFANLLAIAGTSKWFDVTGMEKPEGYEKQSD